MTGGTGLMTLQLVNHVAPEEVRQAANDRVIFVCSDVLLALQIVAMIKEAMTDMDSFS